MAERLRQRHRALSAEIFAGQDGDGSGRIHDPFVTAQRQGDVEFDEFFDGELFEGRKLRALN